MAAFPRKSKHEVQRDIDARGGGKTTINQFEKESQNFMRGQIDNLIHSLNEGMNHSAQKDLKAWTTTEVSDYTVLPLVT